MESKDKTLRYVLQTEGTNVYVCENGFMYTETPGHPIYPIKTAKLTRLDRLKAWFKKTFQNYTIIGNKK